MKICKSTYCAIGEYGSEAFASSDYYWLWWPRSKPIWHTINLSFMWLKYDNFTQNHMTHWHMPLNKQLQGLYNENFTLKWDKYKDIFIFIKSLIKFSIWLKCFNYILKKIFYVCHIKATLQQWKEIILKDFQFLRSEY